MAEEVQELEEPVDGVSVGAAAKQCRDFGLVEAEEYGVFRLGEFALFDEVADVLNESCLGEQQVGVG